MNSQEFLARKRKDAPEEVIIADGLGAAPGLMDSPLFSIIQGALVFVAYN